MTYIKTTNNWLNIKMWSDSRLVDKQGIFCLCTKCISGSDPNEQECPSHRANRYLQKNLKIITPIFACAYFVEDILKPAVLDSLYEPTQEKVESYKVEKASEFADSWEKQKRIWGLDDNLQPVSKQ